MLLGHLGMSTFAALDLMEGKQGQSQTTTDLHAVGRRLTASIGNATVLLAMQSDSTAHAARAGIQGGINVHRLASISSTRDRAGILEGSKNTRLADRLTVPSESGGRCAVCRVPELDALRGLAAIVIIAFHVGEVSPPLLIHGLSRWGYVAVDLFFAISGYLITSIVLASLDSERFFVNFYARRSLRIWPIYYLMLLALVGFVLASSRPSALEGLGQCLTYTQNLELYWGGPRTYFTDAFAHTWSLAVEEQFYLIWPALIVLAGRRRVPLLAIAFVLLGPVGRCVWNLETKLLVTSLDSHAAKWS